MHRENAKYLQPDALFSDGIDGVTQSILRAVCIEVEKEHIRAEFRPCGTRLDPREVHRTMCKFSEHIIECSRT